MARHPTILIMTEDRDAATSAGRWLAADGYRVVTACGRRDRVRSVMETRPNGILWDAEMTLEDGTATLAALRGHASTGSIPVVLWSGDRSSRRAALRLGVRFFVPKPYDYTALRQTFRRAVQPARPAVPNRIAAASRRLQADIERTCHTIQIVSAHLGQPLQITAAGGRPRSHGAVKRDVSSQHDG